MLNSELILLTDTGDFDFADRYLGTRIHLLARTSDCAILWRGRHRPPTSQLTSNNPGLCQVTVTFQEICFHVICCYARPGTAGVATLTALRDATRIHGHLVVLAGDFNTPLYQSDRGSWAGHADATRRDSPTRTIRAGLLRAAFEQLGTADCGRAGGRPVFTYHPTNGSSPSRLDIISIASPLARDLTTDVIPVVFSDHCAIATRPAGAHPPVQRRAPPRTADANWLYDGTTLARCAAAFADGPPPQVAAKRIGAILGRCTAEAERMRRTELREAARAVSSAAAALVPRDAASAADLATARDEFESKLSYIMDRGRQAYLHTRNTSHERATSAYWARKKALMEHANASTTATPRPDAASFARFYGELWRTRGTVEAARRQFLQYARPTDAPIDLLSAGEIASALASSKPYKAAGPDGLCAAVLKAQSSAWCQAMAQWWPSFVADGLPPELRTAWVSPIPKKSTDFDDPAAYRPITIGNIISRIYATALMRRIGPAVNGIIGRSQTAFLPNRHITDSVARVRGWIQNARSHPHPQGAIILFLDIQKAYDSVEPDMLTEVVRRTFAPPLARQIMTVLAPCTAYVGRDGADAPFVQARGVAQGNPLSPLIFLLVMELLLCALRAVGVATSAYADDTALLLTRPDHVDEVLRILASFASASGLHIHPDKSMRFTLGDVPQRCQTALDDISRAVLRAEYLGTILTVDESRPPELHHTAIARRLQAASAQWLRSHPTQLGRTLIANTCLSGIARYMLNTSTRDRIVVKKTASLINSYVTRGAFYLASAASALPRCDGGAGLQDPRLYFAAGRIKQYIYRILPADIANSVFVEEAKAICLETFAASDLPTITRMLADWYALNPADKENEAPSLARMPDGTVYASSPPSHAFIYRALARRRYLSYRAANPSSIDPPIDHLPLIPRFCPPDWPEGPTSWSRFWRARTSMNPTHLDHDYASLTEGKFSERWWAKRNGVDSQECWHCGAAVGNLRHRYQDCIVFREAMALAIPIAAALDVVIYPSYAWVPSSAAPSALELNSIKFMAAMRYAVWLTSCAVLFNDQYRPLRHERVMLNGRSFLYARRFADTLKTNITNQLMASLAHDRNNIIPSRAMMSTAIANVVAEASSTRPLRITSLPPAISP